MPTLRQRVGSLESSLGPSDPNLGAAFESEAEATPVAPTTTGPQRLTFLIPHEDTVVSFGQEVAPRGTTSFSGIDTGLGGHTASHIDFQAVAGPATTVSIGAPVTRSPAFTRDAVPTVVTGYGMATEGIAYHEAKLQHYCVSMNGDVIVRAASAKPAVLNAPAAMTECNAGTDVSIYGKRNVRLSGGVWAPATPARDADWVTSGYSSTGGALAQMAGTVLGIFGGMQGVVGALTAVVKKGLDKAPGSSTTPQPSGKLVGCAAGAAGGVALSHIGIGAYGSSNATISAGINAGLWANAVVGVVGGLVGGLFGATADLKAFGVAGVSANSEATLAALGKASVKADSLLAATAKGNLHICSGRSVDIDGKDTHLSSGGNAVLYAESGDVLVLGDAFGMRANGPDMQIGSFSNTKKCAQAGFESSKPHVDIVGGKWTKLTGPPGDGSLTLNNDGAKMVYKGLWCRVDSNGQFSMNSGSKFVSFKGC